MGLGITCGSRRCTVEIRHRFTKVKGRVRRIKILHAMNKKAGKLYNTGASPQATYGKEGCGVSPSMMQDLRALAAETVSSKVKGQCATTRIHIHLGQANDPSIKSLLDQVNTWLDIRQVADPIKVTKACWKCKQNFDNATNKWNTITGPMGGQLG